MYQKKLDILNNRIKYIRNTIEACKLKLTYDDRNLIPD